MRVLELKAPVASTEAVRKAARAFLYRPASFSKYTAGMELSLPHGVQTRSDFAALLRLDC